MNKIEVLYICHDRIQLAGAAYSLINMIESAKSSVKPYIIVRRGIVCAELRKRGYTCITVPFILNIKNNKTGGSFLNKIRLIAEIINNYICVKYAIHKLHNYKIQIVHSNSTATSVGYDIAKSLKVKHVWHIREFLDSDFNMIPTHGWRYLYNKIYSSDFVIAISRDIYNHWMLQNSKSSLILPNAVRSINDIMEVYQKKKYIIFCAATLSDNKGTDFAISLFCKSNLYEYGYRLLIIGAYNDNYRHKLTAISDSYNQSGYIDFLGYQSNVKDYLINASALLMCSKREAMGRITVEALFYGCPVLGHNTGGTKDIIVDGYNGYLYDNIDDALSKLNKIVLDDSIKDTFIKNGVEIARKKYSVEQYGSKIIEIYKSILKNE